MIIEVKEDDSYILMFGSWLNLYFLKIVNFLN